MFVFFLVTIHTCCTAMQSSTDGSKPSLVKISLALVSPSLLLNEQRDKNMFTVEFEIIQLCVYLIKDLLLYG